MEGNEDSLNKSSLIAIVMVSTDSSPLSDLECCYH